MKEMLKQIIKQTPLYHPLRNWRVKMRQMKEKKEWENKGRPVPPPHIIKQRTLQTYAEKYNLKVLVETGTYYGDMVEAMKGVFDHIYSIELSKDLFNLAKDRFKSEKHIELIQGNSGKKLKKIMGKIAQPALFWLDGHYSGGVTARGEKDTPIYEELHHILINGQDRRHIIIIDDAHCFGKYPGYPTIKKLKDYIYSKRDNVEIIVQEDSIRIIPKS